MSTSSDPNRSNSDFEPPTILAKSIECTTALEAEIGKPRPESTTSPTSQPDDTATQHSGSVATSGESVNPSGVFIQGYEIVEVLGRGAMGIVYKALQPGLKRPVALKMILAGELAGTEELLRFHSEAEVIARLQHPNIVQIFEVGEDAGRPFFSMEYVDGCSLFKKISATPQPPREAATILRIIALAIQSAHDKNIIHRDIKPANILIANDGTPKITDFGLAKTLEGHSSQTHSGAILGTPSYMSPEQADGRLDQIGPRSDIYSLGAVLYELLTGRAPFKAGSVLDTLQQVKAMEPVAPRQFAPVVPRDLETICLKCLQKDPQRRYETAQALANDLGRFLAGEPILARPVSSPERLWRWCRRHPREAGLSGLIALAIVAWGTTTSILALNIKREKDKTESARVEAVENAIRAEENARQASENAERAVQNARQASENAARAASNEQTARTNEAAAKKNAELAQRHAEAAQRNYQQAMSRMIAMSQSLQKRLSARQMGSGPEIRKARDELLQIIRETILTMGKDLENADLTSFAIAAAHQQLGDLLVRLGLGEEALDHFRKAHDAVKRVADAQPANDKARANLSVMLLRLGDLALELLGDVNGAVTYQRNSRALVQEISDHPRSRDYTEVDCKRMISHSDMHLARTLLAAGELAEARQLIEECLKYRKLWVEREPRNHLAESFLADTWLWLGIALGRQGEAGLASSHLSTAAMIKSSLVSRFPKNTPYRSEYAEILSYQGDLHVRAGRLDDARKSYQSVREQLQILRDQDAEDSIWQSLSAQLNERLAALARLEEKTDEVANHYREALAIRAELCQIEPNNLTWKAAHSLALARTGQLLSAEKIANAIVAHCSKSAPLLLQISRSYATCATHEKNDKKKSQYLELAIQSLASAIAAGWKDWRLIESDAELAPVRDLPGYRTMLDKIAMK